MPDLSPEQLDTLNAFLATHSPDGALTCPITGERVPIEQWNAPAAVVVLGPTEGGYAAVPLTSPAGGVLLVSVVKCGL